jgi:hypothetical protein
MSSQLFSPIQVGRLDIAHRIILAPLTRQRADSAHIHGDLAVTYYEQRASTPGTLLITEATFIAPEAAGLNGVPGIWSQEQIAAWKKVSLAFFRLILYSRSRYVRSPMRSTQRDLLFIYNFGLWVVKPAQKL